jgi:hypothetical protein
VLYKKSLQLFFGEDVVTINDLNDAVGKSRIAHNVGLIVLFTSVEKEGKAKVGVSSKVLCCLRRQSYLLLWAIGWSSK